MYGAGAHTINCVCHNIRSMFRVLGIWDMSLWNLDCYRYERLREIRRICTAGAPSDVAVAAVLFAPKSKQILIFNQDLTKSLQNVGFMILKRPVIK